MPGLADLSREVILDHYRSPRNQGERETPPAVRTEGFNPLCGDEVIVFGDVDDNSIHGDRDDEISSGAEFAEVGECLGTAPRDVNRRDQFAFLQCRASVSLDKIGNGAAADTAET